MKKYLLIIILILGFVACENSSKKFKDELTKRVAEAEYIAGQHDSMVQYMMDNNQYDSIAFITNKMYPLLEEKIIDIQMLDAPSDAENLKSAAKSYLESLIGLVKTQALYSTYNDSITQMRAEMIDEKNVEAANRSEAEFKKYNDIRLKFIKSKGL